MAAALAAAAVCPALGEPDPKVPPGRDPSGIAIALIGPGVDYRRPDVAQRLARDGEGEIIGWDFVDNDFRPFEPNPCAQGQTCSGRDASRVRLAEQLIAETRDTRLIVLRAKDGDRQGFAAAILFAARSPARIIPLMAANAGGEAPDWDLIVQAARRFSNLLFIVPRYGAAGPPGALDNLEIGNLLVVAAAEESGDAGLAAGSPSPSGPPPDVAVVVRRGPSPGPRDPDRPGQHPSEARDRAEQAVARLAALAARASADDPMHDAFTLKRRLLSIAAGPAGGTGGKALAKPFVIDPGDHLAGR